MQQISNQKFKGNCPDEQHWDFAFSPGEFLGVPWLVFLRKRETGNEAVWQQVKVVADGCVPHKANYWLAWNGERFANGRELKALKMNRPELLTALVKFLKG